MKEDRLRAQQERMGWGFLSTILPFFRWYDFHHTAYISNISDRVWLCQIQIQSSKYKSTDEADGNVVNYILAQIKVFKPVMVLNAKSQDQSV